MQCTTSYYRDKNNWNVIQLGNWFQLHKTHMPLIWQKLPSLVMMYKDSSGTFFFLLKLGLSESSSYQILHVWQTQHILHEILESPFILWIIIKSKHEWHSCRITVKQEMAWSSIKKSILLFSLFCIVQQPLITDNNRKVTLYCSQLIPTNKAFC